MKVVLFIFILSIIDAILLINYGTLYIQTQNPNPWVRLNDIG